MGGGEGAPAGRPDAAIEPARNLVQQRHAVKEENHRHLWYYAVMTKKNPHIGSSFESWLDEQGIREEVTAAAIKAVIVRQRARQTKEKEAGEEPDPSSRGGLAKRGPRRMNGQNP